MQWTDLYKLLPLPAEHEGAAFRQQIDREVAPGLLSDQARKIIYDLVLHARAFRDSFVLEGSAQTMAHALRHARSCAATGPRRTAKPAEADRVRYALGIISCLVADAPAMQAMLDTARAMLASPNAWYYEKVAECSDAAWRIMFKEMVGRCVHERNVSDAVNNVEWLTAWDAANDTSDNNNDGGAQDANSNGNKDRDIRRSVLSGKVTTPLRTEDLLARARDPTGCVRPRAERARFPDLAQLLVGPELFARFPNLVLAGGSVCEALHAPLAPGGKKKQVDFDLFVHGVRTVPEAVKLTQDLVNHVRRRLRTVGNEELALIVDCSKNAVNLTVVNNYEHMDIWVPVLEIQLITRLFSCISQVLLFFDFGPARFAYDGVRFYATASALYASENGLYFLEPALCSFPKRVSKYQERGFLPVIPHSAKFAACMEFVHLASYESLKGALYMLNLTSIMALQKIKILSLLDRMSTNVPRLRRGETHTIWSTADEEREADDPPPVVSGSGEKDVSVMMNSCLTVLQPHPNPHMASAVQLCVQTTLDNMHKNGIKVWEVYTYGSNYRLASSFCASTKKKCTTPLLGDAVASPEQWRLDKPLVNLAKEEDGSDFMAVPELPPPVVDKNEDDADKDEEEEEEAARAPKRARTS